MVTYISCVGYQSGALQNNHLKNNHPLRVILSITDYADLQRKSCDNRLPKPDTRYAISLVGQTNYISPYLLPLTIPLNTSIQTCASFWCTVLMALNALSTSKLKFDCTEVLFFKRKINRYGVYVFKKGKM